MANLVVAPQSRSYQVATYFPSGDFTWSFVSSAQSENPMDLQPWITATNAISNKAVLPILSSLFPALRPERGELVECDLIAMPPRASIEVIKALGEQISAIEKTVLAQARQRKEFELLKTVYGVGSILAQTIMYEAGEISRFESVGDYCSYARCVGSRRMSNGKKKGENNTKNGNRYLAWAFVEAANFACRFYPLAQRFVQRKSQRRNYTLAVKALGHKLARACYYVMRDQVEFSPLRLFT